MERTRMERVKAKMPYIIAEIGFNHEGNINLAGKMIEKAAKAGAHAVKFQTYRAADLALPSSKRFKKIQKGELSFEQHKDLADIAKSNKVDFLSTPYSLEAVDLLEKVGVKAYKIASTDCTNDELLKYVAKTGKPIMLSTGMACLSEIVFTVNMLRRLRSNKLTLLHCVSKYPARAKDINLAFMLKMKEACKCQVGYSDHTRGTTACLVAAILGARVIEKHFTLDTSRVGADHFHSADSAGLKQLIEEIRCASTIIGTAIKGTQRPDRKDTVNFRRGIYARRDIAKGTKISRDLLLSCRPESEFSPKTLNNILGRITERRIKGNTPIRAKYFTK